VPADKGLKSCIMAGLARRRVPRRMAAGPPAATGSRSDYQEECLMRSKRGLYLGVAAIAAAGFLAAAPASAQTTVAIDNDDIGGVVRGPNGPEAGGWVIAETTELGNQMAKMVVTDDHGGYGPP